MDMKCPVCLEPYDNDVLHEVATELNSTYRVVARNFRTQGCGVAFKGSEYDNSASCKLSDDPEERAQSNTLAELADLMGDDTDGYMSMVEDFGL